MTETKTFFVSFPKNWEPLDLGDARGETTFYGFRGPDPVIKGIQFTVEARDDKRSTDAVIAKIKSEAQKSSNLEVVHLKNGVDAKTFVAETAQTELNDLARWWIFTGTNGIVYSVCASGSIDSNYNARVRSVVEEILSSMKFKPTSRKK